MFTHLFCSVEFEQYIMTCKIKISLNFQIIFLIKIGKHDLIKIINLTHITSDLEIFNYSHFMHMFYNFMLAMLWDFNAMLRNFLCYSMRNWNQELSDMVLYAMLWNLNKNALINRRDPHISK